MIAVDISIVKSYTAFHFLWHTAHHRSMCAPCYVLSTPAKRNAQSSKKLIIALQKPDSFSTHGR
jgi:hypothetical protein